MRHGRRSGSRSTRTDLTVTIGSVTLPSPIMTASGTAGYGTELAPYVSLDRIGALVVKSLSPDPWPGNPAPRVHETPAGMINSVGLQGPGIKAWVESELPGIIQTGARVVVSIWGRSIDDYERAADMLAEAPPEVIAVEINLSCPNVEARDEVFAHNAEKTRVVVEATASCGRPRWAKLSPNVTDLVAIASAARSGGAEGVTLVNTLMAMAIDPETRRPRLAKGGGGLSGPAIHPIAVRAVHDVRAALPELPIVGVGGVASGTDAVELLLAGAQGVQVGTASFAEPAAVGRIQEEVEAWCAGHGVDRVAELIGGAHD